MNGKKKRCFIAGGVLVLIIVIAAVITTIVLAVVGQNSAPNGRLAQRPPMGWNSWSKFHCNDVTEPVIKAAIDGLVDSKLHEAGYNYVIIGDCWQSSRDAAGNLVPDTAKFPHGQQSLQELSDLARSKGLKFGLHVAAGSMSCSRRPGSDGHYTLDSQQYQSWGVSYITSDNCWLYPATTAADSVRNLDSAMRERNPQMLHSVQPSVSAAEAARFAQMRMLRHEMEDDWGVMLGLVDDVTRTDLRMQSRPGFWTDIGALQVGNGGMGLAQYVAHFALWCALKAPLMLSNKLTDMTYDTRALLSNTEMLAVNQDELGQSVQLVYETDSSISRSSILAVSRPCENDNQNQMWHYSEPLRQLRHRLSGRCLAYDAQNDVIVVSCATGDILQQWWRNSSSLQVHASARPLWCLTTSTMDMVPARLRPCDARQRHKNWRGPNRWNQAFNDAFEFTPSVVSGAILVQNSNQRCMAVGAHPDMQIYVGNISATYNVRYVAVMLNRDIKENQLQLNWTVIPELYGQKDNYFLYRDLYRRENLGLFRGFYRTKLPPRSAQFLLMTSQQNSPNAEQ